MYRYPNGQHYINSLYKANGGGAPPQQRARRPLSAQAGPRQPVAQPRQPYQLRAQSSQPYQPTARLSQPVMINGDRRKTYFLTKSRSDGLRRLVTYKNNIQQKPNQKQWHGAVIGPDGDVWYVPDKHKNMVRKPTNEAEQIAVNNYTAKVQKKKGQQQNQNRTNAAQPKAAPHPQKKHNPPRPPAIVDSPYQVLQATRAIIKGVQAMKADASKPNSAMKFPNKLSGSPHHLEALQEGLKKFVADFDNSENSFHGRDPKQILGHTLREVAEHGDIHLFADDHAHEKTTAENFTTLVKELKKLESNIKSAMTCAKKFKERVAKSREDAKKIAEAAGYEPPGEDASKEEIKELKRKAANKLIQEGEASVKWCKEVSQKLPLQVVLNFHEIKMENVELNWTNFSSTVAKEGFDALYKLITKHEAVFKDAVKSAKAVLYHRVVAAKKIAEKEEKKGSPLPSAGMQAGARAMPNLFSMRRG